MSTAPARDLEVTDPGTHVPPRVPWIGLGVAAVILAASAFVPTIFGWQVYSRAHPSDYVGSINPLHSLWDPRVGIGTIPALVIAALGWRYAADVCARLSWRHLLLAAYAASLAWMLSLALVDGGDGVTAPLQHSYEYLQTARGITDVPQFLSEFTSRIPIDAENNWTTHVAGHPPGATLFFIVLARLGLGSGLAAALIVCAIGASIAPAVLVTLRTLGVEDVARRVAPFLVLTPAAIWLAVSADGMFAATAAWGMAALAMAATATTRGRLVGFGVVAGLVLGWCVMLSYGLPALGILALAILVAARSWKPLALAVPDALAVVLAFAALGFRWWSAFPVLKDRYWAGTASSRPGLYWTWGDLGSFLFSGGPLLGAGVAVLVWLVARRRFEQRTVLLLAGAGVAMVLFADVSQLSRAEVERIWLPFAPWVTLSVALLPERWRRPGLGLQIVTALLLQHLCFHSW
ncbi:hypothetical protein BH11ACT8_BH11ACT8_24820 [soil metagenome]